MRSGDDRQRPLAAPFAAPFAAPLAVLLALALLAIARPGASAHGVERRTANEVAVALAVPTRTDTLEPLGPPLPLYPPTPTVPERGQVRGVVDRRNDAGPVVALTFDDAWNATRIREILHVSVALRAPVTFFPTSKSLRLFPELWRQIAAAGYPIANHTENHRFLAKLLAREGAAAVRAEIRGFAETAKRLGITVVPIMRPPYGDRHSGVDAISAAAGFPTVAVWNTSFADTAPRCRGSIRGHYRAATRGRAGAIVLGHAGPALTSHILASVITRYRERGLQPVTLPTLLTGEAWPIDWRKAAAAVRAPARDPDGPPVLARYPLPWDVTDGKTSPGAMEGRCP